MGKAAVGFRDGELAIAWHRHGTPSTDGMTDAVVVDAATKDDALAAYDAAKGTSHAATKTLIDSVLSWWESTCAAGYDTGLGWHLAMQDGDRDKLDQMRNQLRIKGESQSLATYYPAILFDASGVPHAMSGEAALAILDSYADYVESQSTAFAGYLGGSPLPGGDE